MEPLSGKQVTATSVCFSGFRVTDELLLHALAEAAWVTVVDSVTPSLGVLCIGESPDAAQVAKAQELGIPVMPLKEFYNHLVATGKFPE